MSSGFDLVLACEMPPRPKLTRGVWSKENHDWDLEYLDRYFPKDGPDLMRKFHAKAAKTSSNSVLLRGLEKGERDEAA